MKKLIIPFVALALSGAGPAPGQEVYKPDRQLTGQNSLSEADTVAFFLPNMRKQSFRFLTDVAGISGFYEWGGNLYQFNDGNTREIEYGDLQRRFIQAEADKVLRNTADGALTMVTGIGFSSVDSGRFEVSGIIKCNDSLPDWKVLIFCEGHKETERERIRDDDGGVTGVSTNETFVLNWEKDATGLLIEGSDTIGSFLIVMDPLEDSTLKSFAAGLFPSGHENKSDRVTVKSNYSARTAEEIDFGVSGIFCGHNFFIISDGVDRMSWIFIDNTLISMFQEYRATSRKSHIMPYLLVNKIVTYEGRRDHIRLAITGRCINAVLN